MKQIFFKSKNGNHAARLKAIASTAAIAAMTFAISVPAHAAKVTHTWWNTTVYFNKKETGSIAAGAGGVSGIAAAIPDPTVSKVVAAVAGSAAGYAGVILSQNKCLKFVYYGHAVNVWQPYSGKEAGGYCK